MNNIDLQFSGEISRIRNSINRSSRVDYVTTYTEREFLEGKSREERVLILRTRGCSWSYHSGCSMCGYWDDTNPDIGKKELEKQISEFLEEFPKGDVLKIFTSGSFFDPIEVESELQFSIIDRVLEGYRFLVVESRPEYIKKVKGKLAKYSGKLQVAIGLESINEDILKYSLNKNYGLEDFNESAETLHQEGISVRVYLLLKPPYLSEEESIIDAIKSAKEVSKNADFISINPMNIQKGTLVERLYMEGSYRPPWLWSVVQVLNDLRGLKVPVVSLITGSGKKRGAHNGHSCDRAFSEGIRKYSETLDFTYLDQLDCQCKASWNEFMNVEGSVPVEISEVVLHD